MATMARAITHKQCLIWTNNVFARRVRDVRRCASTLPQLVETHRPASAVSRGMLLRSQQRFTSSTITPIISTSNINGASAEEIYQSYLQALDELQTFRQKQERIKNEQMFEAWRHAEEQADTANDANPKRRQNSAGVAVVKTLVKETHKEKARIQEQQGALEQKVQSLLELAATNGHGQALVQLGNQTLERAHAAWNSGNLEKTRQHLDDAMDLYRKSQSPEGWFNLGNLLWTGYPDLSEGVSSVKTIVLPADEDRSMLAFKEAINLGDADAMYFVGAAELGSVDDDDDETIIGHKEVLARLHHGHELIEQAASQGHGGALYYLALLHLNGHKLLDIPPATALEFTKRLNAAADAKNTDALFLRGHCCYNGDHGYPCDVRKALDNFLQAADGGNADAAVSAGAILFNGHAPVIARNPERAFALYQHAGELGSIEGWRNVVACYATGEGVARNEKVAKYIAETMLKDADKDQE